jgi:ribosomal protein S2
MRKIANALNIGFMTVRNHQTESLRMKCYHMRWVPGTLTAAQNAKHTEMAGSRLQMLESHIASDFRLLWTDDESWMFDDYHHEIMSSASCEEVKELERPTRCHRKTRFSLM